MGKNSQRFNAMAVLSAFATLHVLPVFKPPKFGYLLLKLVFYYSQKTMYIFAMYILL